MTKKKGKEKQKSKIKCAANLLNHDYHQYNYISHNDEMFPDHHFPDYDVSSGA